MINLMQGDCLEKMKVLADNSVDSIVTDPPYELGFQCKSWDSSGIAFNVGMWKEAFRVLKPGGHLLAFSAPRTQHRMVCAIEDAGFEIRDQIMWVFGSGFPKSQNISKAIDKAAGAEREVIGVRKHPTLKDSTKIDRDGASGFHGNNKIKDEWEITSSATDAAKQWDGWGTALKPAHEPICMARKPLSKGNTIASNVLACGTGAINVDACRVALSDGDDPRLGGNGSWTTSIPQSGNTVSLPRGTVASSPLGRFPGNLIHDGSEEVVDLFPISSSTGKRSEASKNAIVEGTQWLSDNHQSTEYTDSGSAARFFYCAKTSKKERNEGLLPLGNLHPTVKPTDLMAYLCRLVTPTNGTVLDPFMGSGSTGKAAIREGFNFIGIELSDEYMQIAKSRIEYESGKSPHVPVSPVSPPTPPEEPTDQLFDFK